MIRLDFSAAQIQALEHERFWHSDAQIRKRMEVVFLKSQGVAHGEICRLCRICKTTLSSYLKIYQRRGIEGLVQRHYRGPVSALDAHAEALRRYFHDHPVHTLAQARAVIAQQTGLDRSPTQIRAFLKRLGMRFVKAGALPGDGRDEDRLATQEAFEKEKIQPRLQEAAAGQRAVFFCGRRTLCVR